jgi:hypothetical protein
VYRDRNGSIWSFASTRGLSKEMRDSHSYKSVANSLKSSPSLSKLLGGLIFGILTIGPRAMLSGQLILTRKCLDKGSGDGAAYNLATR